MASATAYKRGSVVLAKDPFKSGNRPFVVVSEGPRPNIAKDEHTAIPLTTVERPARVEIAHEDLDSGFLKNTGWASPWTLLSLEGDDIVTTVGTVGDDKVNEVCEKVRDYLLGGWVNQ